MYAEVRRQLGSTASQPEIFSTIANQWRNMSATEKAPYVQKVYIIYNLIHINSLKKIKRDLFVKMMNSKRSERDGKEICYILMMFH